MNEIAADYMPPLVRSNLTSFDGEKNGFSALTKGGATLYKITKIALQIATLTLPYAACYSVGIPLNPIVYALSVSATLLIPSDIQSHYVFFIALRVVGVVGVLTLSEGMSLFFMPPIFVGYAAGLLYISARAIIALALRD